MGDGKRNLYAALNGLVGVNGCLVLVGQGKVGVLLEA